MTIEALRENSKVGCIKPSLIAKKIKGDNYVFSR